MVRSGRCKIMGKSKGGMSRELGWISSWPLLLHIIFRNSVYTYFVLCIYFFFIVDAFFPFCFLLCVYFHIYLMHSIIDW